MTEGSIRTGDGCRIAWRRDGVADAPVLVLSNSLGTTMDMWAPQMAALTRTHQVVRYDSRGHGRSDAPAGDYSIDRLGRDAVELLDALAITRVAFCGLSLGGMIGQWLGVRAPERVQRLILANTSAYMGPPEGWQARIDTVRTSGMTAITAAVVERWFSAAFREDDPPSVERIRAMLLGTAPTGYAGCCAAIRDMDQRRTGALIDIPTLVIGGSLDPATPPDHARSLANAIPGARLAVLETAHLSNVERAADFTDRVAAFLA